VTDRPVRGLLDLLRQVPDPRGREGQRHPSSAMLAAVVCATLCGFRGLRQTVRWLDLHGTEMAHLLGFTRHPPVRQTIANLLARIDVPALEQALVEFIEQQEDSETAEGTVPPASPATPETKLDVEVWDGKTLRGTRQGEQQAEQVLVRLGLILGRVISSTAIPRNTNESAVALELVRRLVLKGKLIVADALYCQREFCQAVVDGGGEYLVTVKGNQPNLLRAAEQAFVIPRGFSPLRSARSRQQAADGHNV
jgi:predicted transposase YbfD/YdcC